MPPWSQGRPDRSAVLVLDALSAARPLAGDVVEGAEHAAGAALDAVLVVDDDLLVVRFPLVDLRGADRRARLVLALGHARRVGAGVLEVDVRLGLLLPLECPELG